VTGVAGVNSASKITVVGIPDDPDSMARILQVLSRSGAHVQTIAHNTTSQGSSRSNVSLIVPASQAGSAIAVLHAEKGTIGFRGLQHDGQVGRVSVTGLGMRSSPEIFCTFLKALSDADVDLDLVDISETSVGAITQAHRLADAERAVRLAFGMAPADEETTAGHVETVMAAELPAGPWASISGQDMTSVLRGGRTVARHF
jgi:aspartate kinase